MINEKEYNPYAIQVVGTIDPVLDTTSRNAVENRVVAKRILQIESKTDTIDELESEVAANTAEIAILKENLGSAGGTSTENQQALSKLQLEVNALKDKFDAGTGKLKTDSIPDVLLGNVMWRGIIKGFQYATPYVVLSREKGSESLGDANVMYALPTHSQYQGGSLDTSVYYIPKLGEYFINDNSNNLTWDGVTLNKGDWLIWQGGSVGWGKVDNTDAVTRVAGLTGNITVSDLLAALDVYSKDQVDSIVSTDVSSAVTKAVNTSY